jgi:hypothetical protein
MNTLRSLTDENAAADNEAVWRNGGIIPQEVQWKPPLRQAAGTLCVIVGQRSANLNSNRLITK